MTQKFSLIILFSFITTIIFNHGGTALILAQSTTDYYYPIDLGAKCEPYIGDDPNFQYNLCEGILDTPSSIYVGSNSNQTWMRSQVEKYFTLIFALGGEECKGNSSTFINLCSFFFVECFELNIENYTNPVTGSNSIILPKRSCLDNCITSAKLCGITREVYDCEGGDPEYLPQFLPQFPTDFSLYNLTQYGNGSDEYQLQCLDAASSVNGTYVARNSCPSPLMYVDIPGHPNGETNGYYFVGENSDCVISCPVPIYSSQGWNRLYVLHDVISYLSFFGAIFMFITYVVLNKLKTNNDKNLALFLTHITIMSISGILNTWYGHGSVGGFICRDNTRTISGDNGFCVFNGFLFQFGALSASMWFVIMAFEIWYTITRVSKKLNLFKYYLCVVTLICLLFSVIPLGLKVYGYNKGNFMCWIIGSKYSTPLFWIPLGIILSVATIFILLVMYQIYSIVKATGRSGIFKLEIKPMLLVFSFYCSFVYTFFWNFYTDRVVSKKIYSEGIPSFVECLLSGREDCTLMGPDFAMLGAYVVFLRIYGLYAFLIYGFSPKCKKIWIKSIFVQNRFVGYFYSKIQRGISRSTPSQTTNPNAVSESKGSSNTYRGGATVSKIDVQSTMKSLDYDSDSEEDLDDNQIKLEQRDVSTPF